MPLDLPVDVLRHILAQVATCPATLYSILRVSRPLLVEAQPILYRRIIFKPIQNGDDDDTFPFTKLERLSNTITDARNIHLAHHIQHFSLTPGSGLSFDLIKQVDEILRLTKNLKSLEFDHAKSSSDSYVFPVMESDTIPFSLERFAWHHSSLGENADILLSFIESQPGLSRLEVPYLGWKTPLRPLRSDALSCLRVLYTSLEFMEALPASVSLEAVRTSMAVNLDFDKCDQLGPLFSTVRAASYASPFFIVVGLIFETPTLEFLENTSVSQFPMPFPSFLDCKSLRCIRLGGVPKDPEESIREMFASFPSLRFVDYYKPTVFAGRVSFAKNTHFHRQYRDTPSPIAIEQPYEAVYDRWEQFVAEAEDIRVQTLQEPLSDANSSVTT